MKYAFGALALVLTFYAFIPYIKEIKKGQVKPHLFSWIIWGVTTFIVFFAQLADEGGLGAWPTGVSGLITLYIAYLSAQHGGDYTKTRFDWALFLLCLTALPFWFVFKDPLVAVVILTSVDLVGFIPTFTKAYRKPFEESLMFYLLFVLRNLFSILALESFSVTTVLFPAAIGLGCAIYLIFVLIRRSVLRKSC